MLVTTWKTPGGWLLVRDALTIGPRDHEDEITPHTRPPADDDADHMLVRLVECIYGEVEVELVCEPAFDYGRTPAEWTLVGGDRHAADATGAGQTIRLRSDLALGIEGNRVRGRHVLKAGDQAYCALSWAEELAAPETLEDADARIAATVRFWRAWLGRARIPDHRFRDPVQRSALVIKGLTYMPTGATVAALTTSLPETPGGERNWDYRYTWMRDTTFTLQALHWLNLDWEADEFMQFIADVEATEDGSLQIMYGIDGRRDLTETTRDDLSGYAGARPVRIGNGAFDQKQERRLRRRARLDPAAHAPRPAAAPATVADRRVAGGMRHEGLARARPGHLGGAGQAAALCLLEADGLGRARPGRASSPGSAATPTGRRPGARRRRRSGPTSSSTAWTAEGCSASTTTRMRSTRPSSSRRIFGFLPGNDERLRATVAAIAEELTEHGFVLRYHTAETDDGLSGKEGTFLICSFWLVSALAIVGELQKARDLMERLLRIASPLGLYAEEFEAETGAASRQLPAGLLAPRAPGRRGADHRARADGGLPTDRGGPWTPTT